MKFRNKLILLRKLQDVFSLALLLKKIKIYYPFNKFFKFKLQGLKFTN